MSDTLTTSPAPVETPAAPVVVVPAAPVAAPNLSAPVIDKAVTEITTAVESFIPAPIRATIYSVGGVVAVAGDALAPVFGGTVGIVLGIVGGAATALVGTLALSHIKK